MLRRMTELQSMVENIQLGRGAGAGAGSSGYRAPRNDASRTGGRDTGGEHLVLLQFDEPMHIGTLRGLEASYRSKFCPQVEPTGTDSKRLHNLLAVKFSEFDAAARYAAQLNGKCSDPAGRAVEVIHKGAKAGRPPHIVRRGEMLHPFYALFERCLKSGEKLQPHHTMRGDTQTVFYAYLDGEKPVAVALGTVKWTDDGEANVPTAVIGLYKSIDAEVKRQFKALVA